MGLPEHAACLLGMVLAGPVTAQPGLDCAQPPYADMPELTRVVTALAPAFTGFPALNTALTSHVSELCLWDGASDAQGYFEPETRRIVLQAGLSEGLQQAILVHELRHAAQYATGICPGTNLAMRDYAQAIFALEADASVAGLVVADFLRHQGQPDMWQALETWPMQADITAAYADALRKGDDTAQAASVAFDAWYKDPVRRRSYYISACLDYLDRMEDEHLLPHYESLDPAFYRALCRLPDGTAYACDIPETGD